MAGATKPSSTRLLSVDFVRVYVIFSVVVVHVITQPPTYDNAVPETLLMLFHVSREIFFILTGLVLTYTTLQRPTNNWPRFWWRRYPAILAPYLVWSLIYLFFSGFHFSGWSNFFATFGEDLKTGTASYHLYFLLVTLQLYAAFPLILWLLRKTKGFHWWVFGASLGLQLIISTILHYGWQPPFMTATWYQRPDPWLVSYVFFIIAGCLAGWHASSIRDWIKSHMSSVAALSGAALVGGLAVYFEQLRYGGSPVGASAVFQPIVVMESLCFSLGLFALAILWEERGAIGKRHYLRLSDLSFGVYLCHVLVLQKVYRWGTDLGIPMWNNTWPVWVNLLLQLAIIAPLVYFSSAALIAILRRTPLSLALAGRPRARRAQEEVKSIVNERVAV